MTREEFEREYERLYAWRELWGRLSNKAEPGRLQTRQEAIDRRGAIANNRIGALLLAYDAERQARAREADPEPEPIDPATLPEYVKRKLLAVRDALAQDNTGEAWHQLYAIACPGFDDADPWAKLEGR